MFKPKLHPLVAALCLGTVLTACVPDGSPTQTQQQPQTATAISALQGEWGQKSCLQQESSDQLSKYLEIKTGKPAAKYTSHCNEMVLNFLADGTMIHTYFSQSQPTQQEWQRGKVRRGAATYTSAAAEGFSRAYFTSTEAGVPVLIERFTGLDGTTFVQKYLREDDLKQGYSVSGNFQFDRKSPKPTDLDYAIIKTPQQMRTEIAQAKARNEASIARDAAKKRKQAEQARSAPRASSSQSCVTARNGSGTLAGRVLLTNNCGSTVIIRVCRTNDPSQTEGYPKCLSNGSYPLNAVTSQLRAGQRDGNQFGSQFGQVRLRWFAISQAQYEKEVAQLR